MEIGSATAERVGRREVGGVTRMVKIAPAKPCAACGAHPLGAKRAICRVFSMSGCRKQSFPLAVPPNCMFTAAFLVCTVLMQAFQVRVLVSSHARFGNMFPSVYAYMYICTLPLKLGNSIYMYVHEF